MGIRKDVKKKWDRKKKTLAEFFIDSPMLYYDNPYIVGEMHSQKDGICRVCYADGSALLHNYKGYECLGIHNDWLPDKDIIQDAMESRFTHPAFCPASMVEPYGVVQWPAPLSGREGFGLEMPINKD